MSTQLRTALASKIMPDILLVEDLAYHLHRSPSAIRRLLRDGEIPGRKIGKRWLVDRGALLRLLNTPPLRAV